MRSSSRVQQRRDASAEDEVVQPMPPSAQAPVTQANSFLTSMNVSPFLFKTFNLVSDPSTDSIVSWSADGTTFTVHKPDAMEREILPNVFKHNNFASFVRQLNNYGFRKCHTDRYEFGVAGFQRGSPELLKSLKRHDAQRSSRKGGGASRGERSERGGGGGAAAAGDGPSAALELGAYGGMHSEVEQLKRDRLVLLKEVVRLRESGARTADQVQDLSSRLAATEALQQQMLAFLQQHISPSLAAANSHLIPGRKRRHLLLPPSPGREDAAAGGMPMAMDSISGGDSLALGLEFMEGLSMEHLATAAAAPATQGAPGGLSLLELPDGHGDSPSYHASVPPPTLPSVMAMPSGSDVFEWSDLSGLESPGPSSGGGIPRLDNAEIHAIMRDLRVGADTEVESLLAPEGPPDRPGADGG